MRSGERFVGLARFSPEGPNAEPLRNQGSDSESSKGHDTLTTTRRRSQFFAKSKSNLAPIRATKGKDLWETFQGRSGDISETFWRHFRGVWETFQRHFGDISGTFWRH